MQSKTWSQRELMLSWRQCKSLGYSNKETVQRGPIFSVVQRSTMRKNADFLRAHMENLNQDSGVGNMWSVWMRASPQPRGAGLWSHKAPQCRQVPWMLSLSCLLPWELCSGSTPEQCRLTSAASAAQLVFIFLQQANTHLLHFITFAAQEPVKPPKH